MTRPPALRIAACAQHRHAWPPPWPRPPPPAAAAALRGGRLQPLCSRADAECEGPGGEGTAAQRVERLGWRGGQCRTHLLVVADEFAEHRVGTLLAQPRAAFLGVESRYVLHCRRRVQVEWVLRFQYALQAGEAARGGEAQEGLLGLWVEDVGEKVALSARGSARVSAGQRGPARLSSAQLGSGRIGDGEAGDADVQHGRA